MQIPRTRQLRHRDSIEARHILRRERRIRSDTSGMHDATHRRQRREFVAPQCAEGDCITDVDHRGQHGDTSGLQPRDTPFRIVRRCATAEQHECARTTCDEPFRHHESQATETATHDVRAVTPHQQAVTHGRRARYDHHLAHVARGRHVTERRHRIIECKTFHRQRGQPTLRHVVDQASEDSSHGRDVTIDFRPQIDDHIPNMWGALGGIVLAPDVVLAQLDETSAHRDDAHPGIDEVTGQRIEHDIDTLAVRDTQHIIGERHRA